MIERGELDAAAEQSDPFADIGDGGPYDADDGDGPSEERTSDPGPSDGGGEPTVGYDEDALDEFVQGIDGSYDPDARSGDDDRDEDE
ncbi:hypothetical protein BRD17_00735 [Halobacteriales archaeon SW_7_68_16]|nr:MAG: hypothetical protein BRD17_00735 [Halobacteriales archaeon SW_7_68_16]